MIHHDYLLRMIEEFMRVLSRISELKQGQQPREAARVVDTELHALLGTDRESLLRLSTAEMLARIMRSGTALDVRQRTHFLVVLLKESGDVAQAADDTLRGREGYLKALQLLLELLGRPESDELPEFIPTVDVLVAALADAPLPLETQAALMAHFERIGDFARAEDSLFRLRDLMPSAPEVVDFGMDFYKRLLAYNDSTLDRGNLPRAEVEAGLKDLQSRVVA